MLYTTIIHHPFLVILGMVYGIISTILDSELPFSSGTASLPPASLKTRLGNDGVHQQSPQRCTHDRWSVLLRSVLHVQFDQKNWLTMRRFMLKDWKLYHDDLLSMIKKPGDR